MSMDISAIIVEDEAISRSTLRSYLARYCPNVRLLAEAENIIEGKKLIDRHQPDLVFLDIEMPYGTGFDLLEQFEKVPFEVIFITAFSDYALQALNLSAAYYILKPVSIEELEVAVEKVTEKLKNQPQVNFNEVLIQNLRDQQNQKIVIPTLEGFELLPIQEIIRIEASDNYAQVIAKKRNILVSKTLKHFSTLLEPLHFVRVHKSHLVNAHEVTKYKKGKPALIELSNGDIVPLAPNRREEFLKQFMG
jgi:two-component system, LytTR family, response regulator